MGESRRGPWSCYLFAVVVLCALGMAASWYGPSLLSEPGGSGEFRGINHLPVMIAFIPLALLGFTVSGVGFGLGMAGLSRPGGARGWTALGTLLNQPESTASG